jgi:DNA-binding CsgD family transcriptional regulator
MNEKTASTAIAKITRVTDKELLLQWLAAKEYVKKVELALLEAKDDAESLRVSVEGLVLQKSPISPREREVFDGVMRHLFNKEIAWELHISVRTVKFHIAALLRKLGKRGRHELVESDVRPRPLNERRGGESSRRGGEKKGRQACVPHGELEFDPRNFEPQEKGLLETYCERAGRTGTNGDKSRDHRKAEVRPNGQ